MAITPAQALLLQTILQEIEQNSLVLPTLPDVAMKIQRQIDDPNVSADAIVQTLQLDPALAAQLIRAANSALYSGKPPVEKVRDAVMRLGFKQTRNLVLTIAMNKLFVANNPVIAVRLKQVWERSREVAAYCHLLALRRPGLNPDQAMLNGLLHNIGVLPLCLHIERNHVPITDNTLSAMIRGAHSIIGAKLLRSWNFPEETVTVVSEYENLQRSSKNGDLPDYTDIVTIAHMQEPMRAKIVAWENVAAAKRFGCAPEECQKFLEIHADRIKQVQAMLGL